MTLLTITSDSPGAGKTGVATAIAQHIAYTGRPVRLLRAISGEPSARSRADAHWFSSLEFVPGTSKTPVQVDQIPDSSPDELLVVEADAGSLSIPGADYVVFVNRGLPETHPETNPPTQIIIATDIPKKEQTASEINGIPLISLHEDRILNGFSIQEVQDLLRADLIVKGSRNERVTCDHLVIAPISSDAGQPYLERFDSKAVVVRYDKTDQHLAALASDPECLILTGGRQPSDYLFDAANARGVPVLLSRTDTENTVIALEGIFDNTQFQGERKLERMASLLEGSTLFETLDLN